MDDLTQIKGIGDKTAEKLVKAGIDTFAKLAAAKAEQIEAAKAGNGAEWSDWIAAAKALIAPREMTEAELAALVQSWDEARAALSAAGDQVVEIQALIGALPADADRTALETQLTEAQAAVAKAHEVIATLTPLPEGVRLPDARPAAAAAPTEQVVTSERDADTNDLGSDATESLDQLLTVFIDTVEGRDLTRITVIGPVAGRRRAGFEFNGTPRTILVTPDELAAIQSDPALAVSTGPVSSSDLVDGNAYLAGPMTPDWDFAGAGTIRVRVLGPAKGRRRAGFEFGAEARTVEVTPDQLALLRSDDALAVSPA